MAIQIFGTKKCQDTKKAERWFRERGARFQLIDLADKGISPGELRSVVAALGLDAIVDRGGRRWRDKGLEHMEIDLEEELLADPLLLKTPIVREGRKAVVGYAPEGWKALLG
ncbi:MAG TPA: arsenate reductase family protein [Rectinemataceae bacterium]|nr:arsenate reductase family protein [Rectinemataceae bacterium]